MLGKQQTTVFLALFTASSYTCVHKASGAFKVLHQKSIHDQFKDLSLLQHKKKSKQSHFLN